MTLLLGRAYRAICIARERGHSHAYVYCPTNNMMVDSLLALDLDGWECRQVTHDSFMIEIKVTR